MIDFDNVATFAGVGKGDDDQFEDALTRANALMNENSVDGEVRIFVASEYYFSGHAITPPPTTMVRPSAIRTSSSVSTPAWTIATNG